MRRKGGEALFCSEETAREASRRFGVRRCGTRIKWAYFAAASKCLRALCPSSYRWYRCVKEGPTHSGLNMRSDAPIGLQS